MEPPQEQKHEGNPFSIVWPKRGGDKLVGGYIPRRDADYLNLLALYRGTTISSIFRDAVEKVIAEGEPEEHILQVMSARAGTEWMTRLKNKKGSAGWLDAGDVMARYREYQHEIRLTLIKRNVSENLIIRIIRKLESTYGVGGI